MALKGEWGEIGRFENAMKTLKGKKRIEKWEMRFNLGRSKAFINNEDQFEHCSFAAFYF